MPGLRAARQGLREVPRGMTYSVKEIYYTLQGEGAQTGRAAVFLRFAGCNLWTGLERDRATAVCQFCDTDFVGTDGPGGGKFATAEDLAGGASPAKLAGAGLALCRVHRRRAAVAARRSGHRRAARARLRDRHRDQRHARAAARHRLDLRQPEGERRTGADARQRTEADLSAGGRGAGALRRIGVRQFLPAADGQSAARGEHRRGDAILPGASAMAAQPANPQS